MNQSRTNKTTNTQKKVSDAQKKAQKKYDNSDILRRRAQKRDYMRRKRVENPNYCRWK